MTRVRHEPPPDRVIAELPCPRGTHAAHWYSSRPPFLEPQSQALRAAHIRSASGWCCCELVNLVEERWIIFGGAGKHVETILPHVLALLPVRCATALTSHRLHDSRFHNANPLVRNVDYGPAADQ